MDVLRQELGRGDWFAKPLFAQVDNRIVVARKAPLIMEDSPLRPCLSNNGSMTMGALRVLGVEMADIRCSTCGHKIVDTNYRIVGISLAGWNDKDQRNCALPQNVYKHKDCGSAVKDGEAARMAFCKHCHVRFWTLDLEAVFCGESCAAAMRPRGLPVTEEAESPTEELIALLRAVDEREEEAQPGSLKATIQDLAHVAFIPKNEQGVVVLFASIAKKAGYTFKHVGTRYPDALLCSPSNKILRTEFEFVSGNFILHKHDPAECDLVICWDADRALKPQVLALSRFYDDKSGTWNLRHMAFEKQRDELYA